jgi:hypothetical protein
MGLHQYAEGLRRGVDHCQRLGSVNDGSVWIDRITATNFPGIQQVVDWSHGSGKLWLVANEVFGEGSSGAKEWTAKHLDLLWAGGVAAVVSGLAELNLKQEHYPDGVQQAEGYFDTRRDKMRYDRFRAEGYPIGSGTVESAANTVVHHRMKRPGRGWQRDNAQGMLAGLSELHSGRFERAWQATLASSP